MVTRASALAVPLAFAVLLAGCGHAPMQTARAGPVASRPAIKAAPATPIQNQKLELGGKTTWNPHWDVLVETSLPPGMLSGRAARAVRLYCPRFAQESAADKRAFWAYLFQAMAGAESGLNPRAVVRHTEPAVAKIDPVTQSPIHQEGLLQLTYEDGRRYGCNFDWTADRRLSLKDPKRTILDPAKNLDCGIRILENQILTQGKPLISRSSYWSTLQPGTESYRVFARQMANVPSACGLHLARRRSHGKQLTAKRR